MRMRWETTVQKKSDVERHMQSQNLGDGNAESADVTGVRFGGRSKQFF